MKALVIGGTGPTGPFLVNGLLHEGYDVSILHRGTHDCDEVPTHVERIIGDPHFREPLRDALRGRTFDLVVATYGRIRLIAEVMAHRTERLITIGGAPLYQGLLQPDALFPAGLPVPLREDAPKVSSEGEFRFGYLVRVTEEAVLRGHAAGHFRATHFRYPAVYGPRQVTPQVWKIMRRVMDGRPYIVLPDGGLTLTTRGYSENLAHAVLLAAKQPGVAAGQVYNCGDDLQFTLAQWVQVIATAMGGSLEVIGVPDPFAYPARTLMSFQGPSHHQLFDRYKLRSELGYRDLVHPLEAVQRTVRWYRDHPPDARHPALADLDAHYRTEDAIVRVYRAACEQLAQVEHVELQYRHAYPHPKEPGLARDHRLR
ncbi:MAG: NAD-dependent epimerase/dehydratase family protein [Candidatus Lambdaproteobacteria bacterium]|nr:NAD-dependent epimerase/dehydratase family protein [Candidatus Lambdaproteobacteria bacterium]